MTRTTDDPETFRERWTEYIEDFEHLKSSVPHELMADVDEHMDALKEIVDETAEYYAETQDGEVSS